MWLTASPHNLHVSLFVIFIIIIFTPFRVFHTSVSRCLLTEVGVTTSLLIFLADLNKAVVRWSPLVLLFLSPPIFVSILLENVSKAPITTGISVSFMFHSFFPLFLARFRYLSLFSLSFSFTLWSVETAKSTTRQVLGFLRTLTMSGRLAEIRWSVSISKSLNCLCVSFSRTDGGLGIYHSFTWSNLKFWHNSQ